MINISQCLNPDCLAKNPPDNKFCYKCGVKLLLGDRYRAIRYLGQGGFGRTFEAVDQLRLDTPCVIKQFLPFEGGTQAQNKAKELFKREAQQLCQLGTHPQIPDLLAFFEQDGQLYLIQEFIQGQDLLKEVQQGRFNEAKIRQMLLELLPVLQFIHEKDVIHRDIKPDNIIRRPNNSLVLIDFGIAKQLDVSTGSAKGTITGTIGYAAPEQMTGLVYPCSDLYSLAVTAIRLLTGCFPDEEEETDPIFDSMRMQWLWWPYVKQHGIAISSDLAMILDKMLKERVKDRYQSAAEVLKALKSGTQTMSMSKATVIQTDDTPPQRTAPTRVSPPAPPKPLGKLPVKLVSKVGVDYSYLHDLLVQGKWEQANQETAKLLLRITAQEKRGWIKDVNLMSSLDLKTIDQLWLAASNQRFGFSVQKRLWAAFGYKEDAETEERLGFSLGWRKNGDWINYSDLRFSSDAPIGHLPVIWGILRVERWEGMFYFLSCVVNYRLLD